MMSTEYIAFIGNPGAGKSTLLNSLIGRDAFSSGLSIGTGLTPNLQQYPAQGRTYLDTPGLDDHDKRQAAGEAISEGLRKGGPYKLFFVCTLENCRAKPADCQVVQVVLDAIQMPDVPFYIIINQLRKGERKKLKEPGALQALLPYFTTGDKYCPRDVLLLDNLAELEGEDNAYMQERDGTVDLGLEKLREFVSRAEAIDIEPTKVQDVDVSDWKEKVQLLEQQLQEQAKQFEQQCKQLEDDFKKAQEDIKRRHDENMTKMQDQHSKQLTEIDSRNSAAMSALQKNLDDQRASAKEAHDKEMKQLAVRHAEASKVRLGPISWLFNKIGL